MNHQDWKPIILNKKKLVKKHTHSRSHTSKIEQPEKTKIKRFPVDLAKQIVQHRISLGMNRKEFARKNNMKVGDLADIECGKAHHNSSLVSKFKRVITNHKNKLERDKKHKKNGKK